MAYAILVAVVVVVLGMPPLILYAMRKSNWDMRSDAEKNADAKGMLVNPEG